MRVTAIWRKGGKLPRIRCAASGSRRSNLSSKWGAPFGSYLGGGVRQNSAGYLVRDDQPRPTTSPPTVRVQQPE